MTTSKYEQVQFLIGGVQKAGTTALHSMLIEHPDIHIPASKELHFFDNPVFFKNDPPNYQHYHDLFLTQHNNSSPLHTQICGDATPSYLYRASAIERVYDYNPGMKWVIILRHPIDRAYSQWNMQRARGLEKLTFTDALLAEPDRLATLPDDQRHKFAYLDRGRYAAQITRLLSYFGKRQCLFIECENMRNNSASVLSDITGFLGAADFKFVHKKRHSGNYANKLSTTLRRQLTSDFKEDIANTEILTQLDLSAWLC